MSTQLQGRAAIGKTRLRPRYASNKTGVAGISEIVVRHSGNYMIHKFVVSPMRRGFNIRTLGRAEAWRSAVQLRAAHECAVLAAKAALLPKGAR